METRFDYEDPGGLGGIVGRALVVYGRGFGTLLAISLIGQFLWMLGWMFLGEVSWGHPLESLPLIAAGAIAFVIGVIPMAMQVPATVSAVSDVYRGDSVSLGKAFDRASARVTWEAAWVSIIGWWLVLGGTIFGLVPGIVFLVWFCLADVVVVLEGERDLHALKRSQRLVRGSGWKVLALLVVGIVAVTLPGILVRAMFEGTLESLLSRMVVLLATPFRFALQVVLYYHLKGRLEASPSRGPEDIRQPEASQFAAMAPPSAPPA